MTRPQLATPQRPALVHKASHRLVHRALLGGVLLAAAAAAHPQQMPSDTAIFSHIQQLTAQGVRVPGRAASKAASTYIHDQFVDSGLQGVAYQEAPTLVWQATQWGLTVQGRQVPCSPMLHTFHTGVPGHFSTGPQGLQAALVHVGRGGFWDFLLKDVKGKIVVAEVPFSKRSLTLLRPFLLGVQDSEGTFPWDYRFMDPYSGGGFPRNYERAMQAGAAGFIGILVDNFASHHQYRNEAYRSYDPGTAMSMPALWLSPKEGAALLAQMKHAEGGQPLRAQLRLEGQLSRQMGRGVYGFLPGMSDETILIQSHHDSATTGAVEDASGAAEVLALARYFGQMPRSARPRTLMFATMDTHFTDYAVHKAFATQHLKAGHPGGRKVVATLTVEHIGREFIRGQDGEPTASGLVVPRGLMVSTEVPGFEALALETMRRFKLERTVAVSTSMLQRVGGQPGLPADSSDFLRAGVPVIALVGAPLYLYDEIDTTDKVAREELGKVARAFAHMVERIGAMPSSAFKRLPDTTDF